jgi:lysophospholipase L1-like esterase
VLGGLLALTACGPAGTSTLAKLTPTSTVVPSVIYVALGASDAVGVGANDPNMQGYVPLIIARLPPFPRTQALNLGISGITLHDALTQELPEATAAHPTLMTVWLGANDFRGCVPMDQYGADLETLLGQLQSQTRSHIFVANLPDMSRLPAFQNGAPEAGTCLQGDSSDQIRVQVVAWNAVIDAVVARHGDVLVNLFTSQLAAHPEYIAGDGFHPSTAGYAVLANLFWTQIQAHGGVPAS